MKVAAITGIEAEARIARRAGLEAAASGGRAVRTLALAETFLHEGADALLSFGIAGALAPHLATGALLLPRLVLDEDGSHHAVDETWRARVEKMLAAAGRAVESGVMLGAAEAAATPARKAALFQATGSIAVDLESHLVARASAAAKRPFLVLRAIADPASRALPPAAVNGLDENGAPALGRVLSSVLRDPTQIPALIRLAGDTRTALFALRSALKAGPI
jgi:adenosylhomocysteine nucleosidase